MNFTRILYVLLLPALLCISCMTPETQNQLQDSQFDPAQEEPSPAVISSPRAPTVINRDPMTVPKGYYDKGIVTFSGETSPWEMAAGIHDPSVKGVEILVEWKTIEPREGIYDWSSIDETIALWGSVGKYVTIRLVSANQNTHITPQWFFDTYKVRRIAQGLTTDFERREPWFESGPAAELTKDRPLVIDRLTSMQSIRNGLMLKTDTGRLSAGKRYGFQFDYRVVDDGSLTLRVSSVKAGAAGTREYVMEGRTDMTGLESWTVDLGPYDDYTFQLISNEGHIVIDNLSIHEITSSYRGNVGFPNYFDPIFKQKWEQVVTKMAERYDTNPHVDTIVVTGYGRWGEINLEGDEIGARDDQWLWVKWSEPSYLDHVQWAAELYKRLFPSKRLRMVAGGFSISSMTDHEMLYWRVMNMCNSLGIEMKLNGLQEGFGIWRETMFSYGAHRFKHDEDFGIVLETAGQIYRNTTGVDGIPTGHPISLLNRALIDGVDTLYLYGPDILSRNIRKHFHYTTEQMGAEVFTQFYNLHGLYNTANETWGPAPVAFTDIWNGIYHTKWTQTAHPHRHTVSYDIIDGRHVIETTSDSRSGIIEYDIDGRLRYSGMYGAVFHVTYLDRGTDSFALKADDHTAGSATLGVITKTDTNQWITRSFFITPFLQSKRNHGEDDHVIIFIDDLGDGTESIHKVEVDHVPAAEWKTETLIDRVRTAAYEKIPYGTAAELSITLESETSTSLSYLDIPIQASSDLNEYRLAQVSVYGTLDGKEELITEKDYFWARDADEIPIPIATGKPYESLRIVLYNARGQLGWYVTEEGQKAVRLRAYSSEPDPWGPSGSSEQFDLLMPSGSLNCSATVDAQDIILERLMIDGSWQTAATDLISRNGLIHFEPQTPGVYRLQGLNAAQITPNYLRRLAPPRPAMPVRHDSVLEELTINTMTIQDLVYHEGTWFVKGPDSGFQTSVDLPAFRNDAVEFSIANLTGSSLARFFWLRDGDTAFSYERSVLIPVVPNDPTLRDYRYNVGEHPLWDGTIKEILLQPMNGTLQRGVFDLTRLALSRPQTLYAWEFDSQADRFFRSGRTQDIRYEDGSMITDSRYASLDSMPNSPNIWADRSQSIEITLKNSSDSHWMDFGWKSELRDEGQATHQFRQSYVELDITSEDTDYRTYTIDCDSIDEWEGLITDISLTFYNEEAREIAIDSIRILSE